MGRQRILLADDQKRHGVAFNDGVMSVVITQCFDIYHNVDFSAPFLDEEGASQSQAFIRVVSVKNVPQSGHKTVGPCPLLGPHLQHLLKHTGYSSSHVVNVYSFKC